MAAILVAVSSLKPFKWMVTVVADILRISGLVTVTHQL